MAIAKCEHTEAISHNEAHKHRIQMFHIAGKHKKTHCTLLFMMKSFYFFKNNAAILLQKFCFVQQHFYYVFINSLLLRRWYEQHLPNMQALLTK